MDRELFLTLFDAEFRSRAFPTYATLRKQGPVVRSTSPEGLTLWLVTRYAEAVEVFKDQARFANDRTLVIRPSMDTPVYDLRAVEVVAIRNRD